MKSLITGVFWPAWEWGPKGRASTRYLAASHEITLAVRDNRRMRILIESDWFQARWPITMAGDQNAKLRFENSETGFRVAKAIKSLTGERGDRLLIDDPHSTTTAESEVERESSVTNFREAANSRLTNPEKSAIIVIMQRLHQGDISGEIIEKIPGYEHLMLPMEFEVERRCVTSIFRDPRETDGELLFPQRFPRHVVDRDKQVMGTYAVAGQFQQRPSPRNAGMFMVDRIKVIEAEPECRQWVRGWDFAGTAEKRADWTVGVLMGKSEDGYVIADVIRKQLTPNGVRALVKATAELDGRDVRVRGPQDPGQAGKAQALDFTTMLDGFAAKFTPVTGEKEIRAEPFAAQMEAGRVMMVRAPWNAALTAELGMFPAGRHDDQVDAASDAYNALLTPTSEPRIRRA